MATESSAVVTLARFDPLCYAQFTNPRSDEVQPGADLPPLRAFYRLRSELPKPETNWLERQVAGALRSTIDAHGPITPQWIGSAAKRVTAQIEAEVKRKGWDSNPEGQEALRP